MLSKTNQNTLINLKSVSKRFNLQKQKTLKEFFPAIFKRNAKIKVDRDNQLWALRNISMQVKKGEIIGIIGPNGAGKSTLLKLIAGVTEPTEGEIIVKGQVSPLIQLGAGFHPNLSGQENIYLNGSILGLTRKEVNKRFNDIVDFAELWDFIDQPVKHYSSGMYMRLGFSIAAHVNPEILLIDEIFAVGDEAFKKKCMDRMMKFKESEITIVFVSHSLNQVANFCERGIWLGNGKIKMEGDVDEVISKYKAWSKKRSGRDRKRIRKKR